MTRSIIKLPDGTCYLVQRKSKNGNGNQLDIFDKNYRVDWLQGTIEIAETFHGSFWFSELRKKCAIIPDHGSCWGALARRLLKSGFKQTGEFRKNPIGSRRGGVEFQYVKKGI